ncbi:hypothetical protein P692DRAFT_20837824 [Suillus brevipes Sb2]|jgi:hypothetical protein|nr:hypothetical protein P692DRAFT_20837824 [Suillus brevipes Sb2]
MGFVQADQARGKFCRVNLMGVLVAGSMSRLPPSMRDDEHRAVRVHILWGAAFTLGHIGLRVFF